MKFHFVLSIFLTKQCFSDSKPIFPHKTQEYTSGIISPPVPGGGHPMSASSLRALALFRGTSTSSRHRMNIYIYV